jgi:hypothetical protein
VLATGVTTAVNLRAVHKPQDRPAYLPGSENDTKLFFPGTGTSQFRFLFVGKCRQNKFE